MDNKNLSVCFFDSGIGGISLLNECVRRLPRVDFTYFADNYRVPYGNLSHDELIKIVDNVFSSINDLKPQAAVIACNTVTAQCISFLRQKYTFEIIGIQPAIKPARAIGGKCLVIATPSTAESEAMKNLVERYGGQDTQVVPCKDLAFYIEQNINNISAEKVKSMLPAVKADSVVLGCTHYVFVKDIIKSHYNCPVFDGINGTADRLCEKLGILDHHTTRAQKVVFCNGDTAKNREIFRLVLKQSGNNSQF